MLLHSLSPFQHQLPSTLASVGGLPFSLPSLEKLTSLPSATPAFYSLELSSLPMAAPTGNGVLNTVVRGLAWTDFWADVAVFAVAPVLLLNWAQNVGKDAKIEDFRQIKSVTVPALLLPSFLFFSLPTLLREVIQDFEALELQTKLPYLFLGYKQAFSILLLTGILDIQGSHELAAGMGIFARLLMLATCVSADLDINNTFETATDVEKFLVTEQCWQSFVKKLAIGDIVLRLPFLASLFLSSASSNAIYANWLEPTHFVASHVGLTASPALGRLADLWVTVYALPGAFFLLSGALLLLLGGKALIKKGTVEMDLNFMPEEEIENTLEFGKKNGGLYQFLDKVTKTPTGVSIKAGWFVDSVAFTYADGTKESFGGDGGDPAGDMRLEVGETIALVEGFQPENPKFLGTFIKFTTNRNRELLVQGSAPGASKVDTNFKMTDDLMTDELIQRVENPAGFYYRYEWEDVIGLATDTSDEH